MTQPSLAIQYHRAAYTETQSRLPHRNPNTHTPHGLMGREVASQQFLNALLQHGRWSRIDALLGSDSDRSGLVQQCAESLKHAKQRRHVRMVPCSDVDSWITTPTSDVLHFPFPPDDKVAWKRHQQSRHGFAISGVTHTMCSLPAITTLWRYVNTPMEGYDRLICTSRAVEEMVRDTLDAMIQHIADTTGETVPWRMGLEVCPLGVDLQTHQPATKQDRYEARRRLGITDDKLVLLFTGRLSHHAKAQPFPMFVGAQQVAVQTGQQVCLVLCGWFSSDVVKHAFEATARRVAPNVRLLIVDGMDPWWRMHAWDTADIFVSLADSIQETFGLTPLEAMSRGIPVVVSDWNGYRDIVVHGETGFLASTAMVRDTNQGLTERLVRGEINYDRFLATVGQTVGVSIGDVCDSLVTLAKNKSLRQQMGHAGRAAAELKFGWPTVIARYEDIWETQREQLREARRRESYTFSAVASSEVYYPPIEHSFRGYPTAWIQSGPRLFKKAPEFDDALASLRMDSLCNHSLRWTDDAETVMECLQKSPEALSVAEWLQRLELAGLSTLHVPDFFAWLCKYGLLVASESSSLPRLKARNEPTLTFVTTCKGRLDDLQRTLPITTAQPNAEVIVVDYSCPQNSGDWVRRSYPGVKVVSVPGRNVFDRSDAKNAGGFAVQTQWMCLLDADIILSPDFVDQIQPLLNPGAIVRSDKVLEGTGGTFLCEKASFDLVGGHDPVFCGWGEQDEDLVDSLQFAGGSLVYYPARLLTHIHHDDSKRTQFHDEKTRAISHTINRIYRSMKWDWSRILGSVPPLAARQRLHQQIGQQVRSLPNATNASTIEIELGKLAWNPLNVPCQRVLQYRLGNSPIAALSSRPR